MLQVSNSGYYKWVKRPLSRRAMENEVLTVKIREVYQESRGVYGSPRITRHLGNNGIQVSQPRVARLMKKIGLKSITRKKYRVCTTDSSHGYRICKNHLDRDFSAAETGRKWVSDMTYIATRQGWLYLTTVMDLADRKIIGWSLSDGMKADQTVIPAFKMAMANRKAKGTLLFHSDRGVQYACDEFKALLKKYPVLQSMSRKGNCWDNAPMESFFKSIKSEWIYHHEYLDRRQASLAVFEYIESWYNRKRLHSALGYLTPAQYEKLLLDQVA